MTKSRLKFQRIDEFALRLAALAAPDGNQREVADRMTPALQHFMAKTVQAVDEILARRENTWKILARRILARARAAEDLADELFGVDDANTRVTVDPRDTFDTRSTRKVP